ncbi:unnamed protein product [Moneuplotes crassus]|uniref:Uncharacterized protein n=1 Tax=Euplotes crassus TaxID=5936 RepID=A0AAD1XRD5_EUPCR|nr:unnamed protein product [Moneuplotes crassus]
MSKFSIRYDERGFIQDKTFIETHDSDLEDIEEEIIPKINIIPEGVTKRKASIRNLSLHSAVYNSKCKLKFKFKKENPFCEFGNNGKVLNKVRNFKMKPNDLSPESTAIKKKSYFTSDPKNLKENQQPQGRMRNISMDSNCIKPEILVSAKNKKFEVIIPGNGKEDLLIEESPALKSRDSNIQSKFGTPYFKSPKIDSPFTRNDVFNKKTSTSLREINFCENRQTEIHLLAAFRSALRSDKRVDNIHQRSILNSKPHENRDMGSFYSKYFKLRKIMKY